MSKRRIRWLPAAARDLEQAYTALRERSRPAAKRFTVRIREAIESLSQHPQIGPVAEDITPERRYRHLIVDQHRIIYRLEGDTILLLRIWDTRRAPWALRVEE